MSKQSKRANNALRHGLYASEIVLPWENEADFTALLEEFMNEYRPQGPTEQELVIDIARLRWLKRRIMRSAQQRFHADAIATRDGKVAKSGFVKRQKSFEVEAKQRDEIRHTLENLPGSITVMRDELAAALEQAPKEGMAENEQVLAAQKFAQRVDTVRGAMDRFVLPNTKLIEDMIDEKSEVDLAYSSDTLERIIRLEGMMDTRFEKTLGRLLALQDMKRTINVKKIEQTPSNRKRVE